MKGYAGIVIQSLQVSTAIRNAGLRKNYVLHAGKKIYCNETLHLSREDLYEENTITGIATDSCWQFKILSGYIQAYSVLSERKQLDSRHIAAMRIGNGPIEPFDPEKLEPIIKEIPTAYKVFRRNNFYRAIQLYNESNTH